MLNEYRLQQEFSTACEAADNCKENPDIKKTLGLIRVTLAVRLARAKHINSLEGKKQEEALRGLTRLGMEEAASLGYLRNLLECQRELSLLSDLVKEHGL